ncbi:radical SAM protein [Alphaproteobacteria bacterium]|nr:radical SAM protein [Alphaproteobacteria bacterium]
MKNLPRVLRIEPASKCNLSCIHCPTGTVAMDRGIMKDEVLDAIFDSIDESPNAVKVVVLYHGGEPLLNKKFFSFVELIRAKLPDAKIKTVTNGVALTKANSEKVLKSSLDEIEVSLDGDSPYQNNLIRVGSDAAKIINNVHYLLELYKEYARERLLRVSIATTQFNPIDISFGDNPPVPAWLLNEFKSSAVNFKTSNAYLWPDISMMENKSTRENFEMIKDANGKKSSYCDHVNNTITVRANGDVVPCCYDLTSKLVMGNVLDTSLLDIWNSENYNKLRDSIHNKKFISICKTCAVVNPRINLVQR